MQYIKLIEFNLEHNKISVEQTVRTLYVKTESNAPRCATYED